MLRQSPTSDKGGRVTSNPVWRCGLSHKKLGKILNVTVEFIAEVITCIKDKDKKIISGDPEKIKKIYDTWVFSRDITSVNPNWQLVNTLT